MKQIIVFSSLCMLLLTSCSPATPGLVANQVTSTQSGPQTTYAPNAPAAALPTYTPNAPAAALPTKTPEASGSQHTQAIPVTGNGKVPKFDHIILIVLENESYQSVIGSSSMPYFNSLAQKYVLLTNYFAVSHPSLPNYLALMSGSTQEVKSDCTTCFVNSSNLADEVMASGRTWKAYQENMPSPCFIGNANPYYQKHDPLLYFDSIRLNPSVCSQGIVPLTQLGTDLAANQLPSFSFIEPNICNSGHNCPLDQSDAWLNSMISSLQASPALGNNYMIAVVFDEGATNSTTSCCGVTGKGGGQVAAVLISPEGKPAFNDATAYSHYSLLKTILAAWNLPDLGQTQQADVQPITAPWSGQ